MTPITVKTTVNAPMEHVWDAWTQPAQIMQWNAASDDWHCPAARNDLRVGGRFSSTMAAKDGSASFDFEGTYTSVHHHARVEYVMADGRNVHVHFTPKGEAVEVIETFDPERENSEELQRQGWQAILNNFKRHVEKSR